MIKQNLILLIIGLFVFSCTSNPRTKKPDNLIPQEKMSDILYDIYIINAAKGVNKILLEANRFVPETHLLRKYHIDSTQFAESNNYYAYDNETYKAIIEQTKVKLEKQKETYEALRDIERESQQSRKDSIKQLSEKTKDTIKKLKDSVGIKLDSSRFKIDTTTRKVMLPIAN